MKLAASTARSPRPADTSLGAAVDTGPTTLCTESSAGHRAPGAALEAGEAAKLQVSARCLPSVKSLQRLPAAEAPAKVASENSSMAFCTRTTYPMGEQRSFLRARRSRNWLRQERQGYDPVEGEAGRERGPNSDLSVACRRIHGELSMTPCRPTPEPHLFKSSALAQRGSARHSSTASTSAHSTVRGGSRFTRSVPAGRRPGDDVDAMQLRQPRC